MGSRQALKRPMVLGAVWRGPPRHRGI